MIDITFDCQERDRDRTGRFPFAVLIPTGQIDHLHIEPEMQ
jgi:hypothetical protein